MLFSDLNKLSNQYVSWDSDSIKNNAVVLLTMAIEVHWSYSLMFVAMYGGDGNGLNLKKLARLSSEKRQKLNTNSSLCHIIFRIISVTCRECYTYKLEY